MTGYVTGTLTDEEGPELCHASVSRRASLPPLNLHAPG